MGGGGGEGCFAEGAGWKGGGTADASQRGRLGLAIGVVALLFGSIGRLETAATGDGPATGTVTPLAGGGGPL